MRKTINKWFWAWESEKEEQWLNEMAKKGLALCACRFCTYEFEPCEPGEYVYRLEYLENNSSKPEGQEYIRFMEETGAKMVGQVNNWAYFRKKAADGEFDLFSDLESRIAYKKRVFKGMFLPTGLLLFLAMYNLCMYATFDHSMPLNLFFGILCAVFACFGAYSLKELRSTIKKLEAERSIHE